MVCRFDGKPYLLCEAGVFVEVAVTVQGITLSQIHPVLDGRNRPIDQPTAFDINTSIQRCLVKAIALHGLGLYVYAGEDLPQPVADAANDATDDFMPEPTVVQDSFDGSLSCTRLLAAGRRCPGFCIRYFRLTLDSDFLELIPAGAQRNRESFFGPIFVHDHRTAPA